MLPKDEPFQLGPGNSVNNTALNTAGIQTVRDLIAPKVTVLMHVYPGAKAAKAYMETLLPEVQKQLPGTIWFQHELESRTF